MLWSAANAANVWPQPFRVSYGTLRASIDPSSFEIIASHTLQQAVAKYSSLMFPLQGYPDRNVTSTISKLTLALTGDNSLTKTLDLYTNESYTLSVDGDTQTATITAESVTGALRGFETFIQLIDFATPNQFYSIQYPTYIFDKPRFPWRGLLIDSGDCSMQI